MEGRLLQDINGQWRIVSPNLDYAIVLSAGDFIEIMDDRGIWLRTEIRFSLMGVYWCMHGNLLSAGRRARTIED